MGVLTRITIFLTFFYLEVNGQDATTPAPPPVNDPTATTIPTVLTTTTPFCSVNETFLLCSSCENQCDLASETCGNICGPPKCQCRDGFYRNSTGACVQGHDCGLHDLPTIQRDLPAEAASSACQSTWCPDGSICLLVPPQSCDSNCESDATCSTPSCGPMPTCVPDVVIVHYKSPEIGVPPCSVNETWMDCSSNCEDTCVMVEQNCTNQCGPAKCQCNAGYYRNLTHSCIQGHDCNQELQVTQLPSTEGIATGCDLIVCTNGTTCKNLNGKAECVLNVTHNCAMNEGWKDCASNCEPSCDVNMPVCAAVCAPSGCQCLEGFFRNENGTCVVKDDCIPLPICNANEELKDCGTTCEPTCENPNLQCDQDCATLAETCQCIATFVRNPVGVCVSIASCNDSLPTNCSTVTCPINKYCEIVNEFAKCVEITNTTSTSTTTTITTTTTTTNQFSTEPISMSTTAMSNEPISDTASPVTMITTDTSIFSTDSSIAFTEMTTGSSVTAGTVETEMTETGTSMTIGSTDSPPTIASTVTAIDLTTTTISTIPIITTTSGSTASTASTATIVTTTTTQNPCKKHERLSLCKRCEDTCRGIPVCTTNTTMCVKGCVCEYGFTRNPKMKCVKKTQCYKHPGCETNETWTNCMAHEQKCEIVANNTTPTSGRQCFNGCGCATGFARNSLGVCVSPEACS